MRTEQYDLPRDRKPGYKRPLFPSLKPQDLCQSQKAELGKEQALFCLIYIAACLPPDLCGGMRHYGKNAQAEKQK